MAGEWTNNFYASKEWRKCRASFVKERIQIDGGLCQMCKEEQGYIVHHRQELTPDNINDPDISLSHSNLMYLCLVCHNKIHGKEKPRYILTADGSISPPNFMRG